MSWLRRKLLPLISRRLTSEARLRRAREKAEAARRRDGRPHSLTVFLRADDPHSQLMEQALPDLQERFEIVIDRCWVAARDDALFPEPDKFDALARRDAAALASLYTMAPLRGEPFAEPSPAAVDEGDAMLRKMGHYLSAIIHYEGEWYWSLARLDHLERRLNALGVNRGMAQVRYTKTYDGFLSGPAGAGAGGPTLDFYVSARSPYSAIAFDRVIALAEHYRVPLDIQPVLPMLMRGLRMPKRKADYILFDAVREARKLGVPFGTICDPLGKGVERCYALLDYAEAEGRLAPYLSSFFRGVWAEGIDAASDRGLRRIVERAGLDWARAEPLLGNRDWHARIDTNQAGMAERGLWGVPSFHYDGITTWGQDRLFMVEQAIVRRARRTGATE